MGILFPGLKKLMKRIRFIGFAGVIISFISLIVVATMVLSTLIVMSPPATANLSSNVKELPLSSSSLKDNVTPVM